MTLYRTIVADPPWTYDSWPDESTSPLAGRRSFRVATPGTQAKRRPLSYAALTVGQIAALPVGDLADPDAHLYLWTTNRYLPDAFGLIAEWGFRYSTTLVWAKTPRGIGPGGAFAQSTEYVVCGRRGSLANLSRVDSTWFNWPRSNTHSRKPEAFLDLVEQVSPGPYLELFARRQRLGWDTWGDEALNHVEIA